MLKLDPNTHKHADIINGIYNATEKVFIDTCHISENDPNFDQMFAEVWRNTVEVIAEEQTTGATVKYKHPHAVLYAVTASGDRRRLSSCSC